MLPQNPFQTDSRERRQLRDIIEIMTELAEQNAARMDAMGGSLMRCGVGSTDACVTLDRPSLRSPAQLLQRDLKQQKAFDAWHAECLRYDESFANGCAAIRGDE